MFILFHPVILLLQNSPSQRGIAKFIHKGFFFNLTTIFSEHLPVPDTMLSIRQSLPSKCSQSKASWECSDIEFDWVSWKRERGGSHQRGAEKAF